MTFADILRGPEKPSYVKEEEKVNKEEKNEFNQEELELYWTQMQQDASRNEGPWLKWRIWRPK